jgi:hypothetical protein
MIGTCYYKLNQPLAETNFISLSWLLWVIASYKGVRLYTPSPTSQVVNVFTKPKNPLK